MKRGLIETREAIYVINPLPRGAHDKYHYEKGMNATSGMSSPHPHIVFKKESMNHYSCPHRKHPKLFPGSFEWIKRVTTCIRHHNENSLLWTPGTANNGGGHSSSLLYSDVITSFMSSHNNGRHEDHSRGRRSIMIPDENAEENLTSPSPKSPVTVETAVFVDETLYEIMKRTFPGLVPIMIITEQ